MLNHESLQLFFELILRKSAHQQTEIPEINIRPSKTCNLKLIDKLMRALDMS